MKEGSFIIRESVPLTDTVFRLRLAGDTSGIEAPGQFVSLSLPGFFLRRPFSVCDWDRTGLSLLIDRVGRGTEVLSALPAGTELNVLSGLGRGFTLEDAGSEPLLIGGGTGLSPLLGLARRLTERGVRPRAVLGFRSREDMFCLDEFHALGVYPAVTTVDGSFGIRGFVTDALVPHSFLYACGPAAMLRALALSDTGAGEFSLDARMGCGFGACMGCTVRTVNGPRRVCRDGPVFRKEELSWDD